MSLFRVKVLIGPEPQVFLHGDRGNGGIALVASGIRPMTPDIIKMVVDAAGPLQESTP